MSNAHPRRFSWAPTLCGWLLGNALQLRQPALWSAAAYAATALAALCLLARVRRPRTAATAAVRCLLAAALLAFSLVGLRSLAFQSQAMAPALEGPDLVLTGTVAALPQWLPDGLRFRLAVDRATRDGMAVTVPPLVELGWRGGTDGAGQPLSGTALPDLRAGERWRFTARLKAPHGSRNPQGFDNELRSWAQGLQAVGTVQRSRGAAPPLRLQAAAWAYPVEQARQRVRDAILQRLTRPAAGTDPLARQRAAGVVAALVTGDQRVIGRADWEVFRTTGTAHLMSISGLHVTLFAWLAAAVVGALWRRSAALCLAWPAPHAALLGGVLLAGLYAGFSGGGIPSQRTVLMLAIVAALRLSGRRWPWPQVWLLAATGAVALDPWAWLQAGFWLSFVAVGVLFASTAGAAAPPPAGWRHGPARAVALLREQAVVTLALAPLTLLLFGQVSLVGLPANLLAIPWCTLVVTPLALLGVLAPPLWELAARAVSALVWLLDRLAAWPHASLALPTAPAWTTACAVAGGALLCMRLPVALRLLGLAPLASALLWTAPRPDAGDFEVLALDVGQGSSILVRTARHALLYDAGPRYSADSDAGQRLVVPLLQARGVRLDTLVLSHRDTDHVGGAAAVLAQQPRAELLASIEPGHPLQALRPARRCEAGQRWDWDGVRFEILAPRPADYAAGLDSNALSCVLRIETDRATALLTGDIGAAEEARLVASGARLAADWLLVPHHGSRRSSSSDFLAAVAPRVVFAQAGYRNRYGHPAPAAVARYAGQGFPWEDSIHCGAQRWSSDRPTDFVCERYREPHYWQHNVP